ACTMKGSSFSSSKERLIQSRIRGSKRPILGSVWPLFMAGAVLVCLSIIFQSIFNFEFLAFIGRLTTRWLPKASGQAGRLPHFGQAGRLLHYGQARRLLHYGAPARQEPSPTGHGV